MKNLFLCLVAKSCPTLFWPHGMACQAPLSMGFPRQEYWKGCHFLLQGIFLTQGSNPCPLHLLHWKADSLPLSHQGSLVKNSKDTIIVYPLGPKWSCMWISWETGVPMREIPRWSRLFFNNPHCEQWLRKDYGYDFAEPFKDHGWNFSWCQGAEFSLKFNK